MGKDRAGKKRRDGTIFFKKKQRYTTKYTEKREVGAPWKPMVTMHVTWLLCLCNISGLTQAASAV